MLYRQLPARSPVPGSALWRAAFHSFSRRDDPRSTLHSLLVDRYNADGAALCASGTHALQLALMAAQRIRGQLPVLLPAYTCYEVATAAIGAGAQVALYDIDPDTLQPDWDSVRAAGADGAAALVVAPLFGMSVDWNEASACARDVGALLIADAAQAHGATFEGRSSGSVGDFAVLSFGRGKGWTGAGGGALLRRGTEMASFVGRIRELDLRASNPAHEAGSAVAMAAMWVFGRPRLFGLPSAIPALGVGETIYHPPTPPAAMTRGSAALLLATDAASLAEVSHRRNNAARYTDLLASSRTLNLIGARADAQSGALRFPLRVRGGWSAVNRSGAPRLGAAPGYPTGLHDLPALAAPLLNRSHGFPGADLLAHELITLPTHSLVTPDQARRLATMIMVGAA